MLNLKNKGGFTLIELLVVITIIGILATGAVTVYTTQIQKARDTTRINDMESLKAGIEQVYQDSSVYPVTGSGDTTNPGLTGPGGVQTYVPRLPKDPKNGETCNQANCIYTYMTTTDDNGIVQGQYELSTAFENQGNIDKKAAIDGGNDNKRYESGNNANINSMSTSCDLKTGAKGVPTTGMALSTAICGGSPNASAAAIAGN